MSDEVSVNEQVARAMSEATVPKVVPINGAKPIGSMAELEADGDGIEYTIIPGFREGQTVEIGSLTAGDLIEWSEANDGPAKRTAGLRLITKSLVSSAETGRIRYAADPKNIDVFRKKNHKATEEMVMAIISFNKLEPKQQEKAKND